MKTSDRVEYILQASKLARNSDKELLIIYMQKSGMNLTQEQIQIFKKMPSAETITRVRRQLQEQGKYPADEQIDNGRYEKYQQMKYKTPQAEVDDILERNPFK